MWGGAKMGSMSGHLPATSATTVVGVQAALARAKTHLLPIVQVAKAADVAGLVLRVARNLHAAHSVHLLEAVHQLLPGGGGLRHGGLAIQH